MALKIERDQRRFRQIVRGKVRDNLRKYISHGEMIGRKDKELVSIPVPQLDVPRFRFGDNGNGGVGQGDGENGTPVGKGGQQRPGGAGEAGSDPGDGHLMEVEITLEELADILGDELELPHIEPKGNASIIARKGQVQQHPLRPAPNRCGTSSEPTSRRSSGRSPPAAMSRPSRR